MIILDVLNASTGEKVTEVAGEDVDDCEYMAREMGHGPPGFLLLYQEPLAARERKSMRRPPVYYMDGI